MATMTKGRSEFFEQYKDPRWQKLRLSVLERDGWRCADCHAADKTLHVHHRYYTSGAAPWDYPLTAFLTLCEDCHKGETENLRYQERAILRAMKMAGLRAGDLELLADAFESADVPLTDDLAALYDFIFSREIRQPMLHAHRGALDEGSRRRQADA